MIQWKKRLNLVAVLPPSAARQFSPNHKQELRKHRTPHVQPSAPSPAITAMFLTHSCPTAALLTVTDASLRLLEWTQGTSWHLTLLTSVFAGVAFFTQHWGSLGGLAVQHCLFSLSTFSRVHSDPGGWSKATVHGFFKIIIIKKHSAYIVEGWLMHENEKLACVKGAPDYTTVELPDTHPTFFFFWFNFLLFAVFFLKISSGCECTLAHDVL